MKKWPRIQDIFSLQPTVESGNTATPAIFDPQQHWQKIKFDNTVRVWIAVPSYLACVVLWYQNAITSLFPISWIIGVYGVLQFLISWMFMDSRHGRSIDFLFASFDLIAMSLAVYVTGGTDSPLYFAYFIPLVVHAFHRDMSIVVYSGFGGVVLYAAAILQSFDQMTSIEVTNLVARIFFMLLTVSIACLALAMLRKQDSLDSKRIIRLKNLTLASETLNNMTTISERTSTAGFIAQLINEGLGDSVKGWCRFFFVQKDGALMHAVADPSTERSDLKQEIPTVSCPVMMNNQQFLLNDSSSGHECPSEKFSFGSHLCLPVSGAENETFGVLFAGSPFPRAFQADEIQFLEFVAKSFGLSIQRLNRMEELRKSLEMNSWVMAATIASSRSTIDTYNAVLDGVMMVLRADLAELQVFPAQSETLKTVLSRGGGVQVDRALVLPLRSIRGDTLGYVRAARAEATEKFSAIEVETASTFVTRASLAIENALAHELQRQQIQGFLDERERRKAA